MSFMREAFLRGLVSLHKDGATNKEWHKNTTRKHLCGKLLPILSQLSPLQQGKSSAQWPKTFILLEKWEKGTNAVLSGRGSDVDR